VKKVGGPNFLILGAPRAGTSWLYTVLREHPSLWLPPVKELHYFDKLARTRTWLDPYERRRVRPRPDLWHLKYLFGSRDDQWYESLFMRAQYRGLIAGEATPDYAVLGEEVLERIYSMNPNIKLILIMRDPIDRSWSAVNNAMKKGRVAQPSPERLLRWALRTNPMARSNYAASIKRLETIFPTANLYYCFFDDLAERPNEFIADVLSFLGVKEMETQATWSNAVNAVARGKPVPSEFAHGLAKELLPTVAELCERFDGPPQRWLARCEQILKSSTSTA
jgi:hypothetical protein